MEGMELFWEPGEKCEAVPTTLRDIPGSLWDPKGMSDEQYGTWA